MGIASQVEVTTLLASFAAIAIGTAFFAYIRSKKKLSVWERAKWQHGGKIEKLWIYPAKSCKGVDVTSFRCTKLGAVDENNRDRVFLFVDDSGNFITARNFPKLVLVEVNMNPDSVTFRGPGMEDITVSIPQSVNQESLVTIWGDKLKAVDCGDKISDWISRYLSIDGEKRAFRLVYHSDTKTRRRVKVKAVWPRMYEEDGSTFADLAPFHLVNEESVKDLCGRLEDPLSVSARNFRPNILISGAAAFTEDNWSFLKIGNVVFRHTKPCDRCVLTTIDPDKGEKNENQEPLRTLRQYRCAEDPKMKAAVGTSPFMGINLAIEKEGMIKVGDTIEFI